MAIYSVIRYEGDISDWLVYKYQQDDFNKNSKLVVATGQVAIVVHNGKIEKIFEEGTYKLDSELLPFLKGFVKTVHGGENPYPIEIYFINKKLKLDLLWGTSDAIKILDPVYKIQLRVRARGQIGVRLTEYQYFYQTLVGSLMKGNYITFDVLKSYFRGILNQRVKKALSTKMISEKITYYEIDPRLDEIQESLLEEIKVEFKKFGFDVVNLSIESINVPDEDLDKLNQILHKKAEYEQLGDDIYRTTRGYDVLEAGAKNSGGSAGTFMGVGLGMQLGNEVKGGIIPEKKTTEAKRNRKTKYCGNCGAEIEVNSKFCQECGEKVTKSCPKCGNEISNEIKFCPECGEKVGE